MVDDREALRLLAQHLVGPAEIGDLLHVEANTINVWKVRHSEFPAPVRRLKSGDLWDVRDVREWAEQTGRYPVAAPEAAESGAPGQSAAEPS